MYKPTHCITREMIGCFDRTRVIAAGTEVMVDDEHRWSVPPQIVRQMTSRGHLVRGY